MSSLINLIYGIGICLDEEKYENASGYREFKEMLLKHLEATSEPKEI